MDDVRGDFLGPPHGTTLAAIIANKNEAEILLCLQQGDASKLIIF